VQQIRLNATTQQNVVTYNVRVSLTNPEQILLPGMTAYVNIAVDNRKDVLLVPNAALRFKPSDAKVANEPTKEAATSGETARPSGPPAGGGKPGRKRDTASGTVYIIDGGELKPVSIQLGITDNRNTEVVSGSLKPGDKVIAGENTTAATGKPSSVGMRMF
jgi:HlyD family secretion protein